jgi:Outer membrane protein beta-barrel domain
MKKIFAVALMLILAKQIFAQDDNTGVRLGLTVSPQISWMSSGDKDLKGNGSYLGFDFGLLADFLIPKNYAFATGILLSYDGGKLIYEQPTKFNTYNDSLFPANTNVAYRTQYLEIPLTLKLRTNQVGYMTYFGQFGLQTGVALRSRADVSSSAGSDTGIDFSEDVSLPDVGLLIGGGIERELTGNTALHISLQFYNGFIDVTDNPSEYKTKSTLNHFRLQLGVYF